MEGLIFPYAKFISDLYIGIYEESKIVAFSLEQNLPIPSFIQVYPDSPS